MGRGYVFGNGCIDLIEAGELGADKPGGARADMAFRASYPGVGRDFVGGVFRLHHRVAQSAAKPRRFRLLKGAVAS